MMKAQLTTSQIQELVRNSNSAPSPDNCQPWKFEWDSQTLSILHLPSRAFHSLNPHYLISHLTLGCLLEAISLSASKLGFKTHIDLTDFSETEGACWARVQFSELGTPCDPLFYALENRTTDRRLFIGGAEEIKQFRVSLPDDQPAQIHLSTTFPEELVAYYENSEQMFMEHPQALADVMKWVQFSIANARVKGDGLSWRNMLVRPIEVPIMYLFQKIPATTRLLAGFLTRQHRNRSRQQFLSSAALIGVSVPLQNGKIPPSSVVSGGRAMMRAWLRLTQMKFGVQPASFLTLPSLYLRQDVADEFFQTKKEHFRNGDLLMRKIFAIGQDRFLLWTLRTGLSTQLPAKMKTFRRSIDEILVIKGAS
jgi:hypothetical protein